MSRKANQEAIDYRRSLVAQLRTQRLSIRAIEETLPRLGCINTATGKRWDQATIGRDCQWLDEQWRRAAHLDTDILVGRELQALDELEREAIRTKNPGLRLKTIQLRARLLGLLRDRQVVTVLQRAAEEVRELGDKELLALLGGDDGDQTAPGAGGGETPGADPGA